MLENGFKTLILFSDFEDVALEEVSVTPQGVVGGDGIDQTNMRSIRYRTKAPRSLVGINNGPVNVHYDPALVDTVIAMANVEQEIQMLWPDGSSETFTGYVKEFSRDKIEEGKKPIGTIVLVCTARDATTKKEEAVALRYGPPIPPVIVLDLPAIGTFNEMGSCVEGNYLILIGTFNEMGSCA